MIGAACRGVRVVGADGADVPPRSRASDGADGRGLCVKMVFFGAYVAVMLRGRRLRAGALRRELHGVFRRACLRRGAADAAPVCRLLTRCWSRKSPGTRRRRRGRRRREIQRRRDDHRARLEQRHDHPLIHLPTILGIDFSVTKHVFMLWLVAAIVFVVVTWAVRRYLKQDRLIPSGFMNGARGGRRVRPRRHRRSPTSAGSGSTPGRR